MQQIAITNWNVVALEIKNYKAWQYVGLEKDFESFSFEPSGIAYK